MIHREILLSESRNEERQDEKGKIRGYEGCYQNLITASPGVRNVNTETEFRKHKASPDFKTGNKKR